MAKTATGRDRIPANTPTKLISIVSHRTQAMQKEAILNSNAIIEIHVFIFIILKLKWRVPYYKGVSPLA